ncbi:hypothetical protein D6T51_12050 [Salmonella enterica subsp. enterica serovar Muenchen]|nr:hypothetical protein [Salmonella enterica subsp. enterica serovar Muenchen]
MENAFSEKYKYAFRKFGYPAIFDEVRQECQINNAHVVAGCGSGYQSVYSRCQSCRTSVRKSSGPG